ncbi:MAG: c-type cytochrome [bacterium]|nr:c-type cytochrome [bacterium]
MIRILAGLLLCALALRAQEPAFEFLLEPPKGLPKMVLPTAYEPTPAMFALGQRLFHDAMLSADRSVSCATCHPAPGFAHPDPRPAGVGGRRAKRHAPSLFNRGYSTLQRWDGASASLEAFVLEPIADPNEMALALDDALARLADDDRYRAEFERVFGGKPDRTSLQRALATFVRGIVRGDSAYDRFLNGDHGAMTAEQRTGFWLFESKAKCWQCHTPGLFTDEKFHNTGIGVRDDKPEPGRARVTKATADTGAFKTPTLRGVALTAPYMHDGSLPTLQAVVEFYVRGGNRNPHLDSRMQPLELSATEQRALIAFLESL